MKEEKETDKDGSAAATFIVILSVILAIFMFFVVSVIEEEYSRAEQEREFQKQLGAEQSSARAPFVTKDIRLEYRRLHRNYLLHGTNN